MCVICKLFQLGNDWLRQICCRHRTEGLAKFVRYVIVGNLKASGTFVSGVGCTAADVTFAGPMKLYKV